MALSQLLPTIGLAYCPEMDPGLPLFYPALLLFPLLESSSACRFFMSLRYAY